MDNNSMNLHNTNALNIMKSKNPNLDAFFIENNFLLVEDKQINLGNFHLSMLLYDLEFKEMLPYFKVKDLIDIIEPQVFIINKNYQDQLNLRKQYYDMLFESTNVNNQVIQAYRSLMKAILLVKDYLIPDVTALLSEYEFIMNNMEVLEDVTELQSSEINYYKENQSARLEVSNSSKDLSGKKLTLNNGQGIDFEEDKQEDLKAGYVNALLTGLVIIISGIGLALLLNL